jgi:hypothetical protein
MQAQTGRWPSYRSRTKVGHPNSPTLHLTVDGVCIGERLLIHLMCAGFRRRPTTAAPLQSGIVDRIQGLVNCRMLPLVRILSVRGHGRGKHHGAGRSRCCLHVTNVTSESEESAGGSNRADRIHSVCSRGDVKIEFFFNTLQYLYLSHTL